MLLKYISPLSALILLTLPAAAQTKPAQGLDFSSHGETAYNLNS